MSAADKHSLEQRLAELLSISINDDREYVVDVLESLVGIVEQGDIADYLSSFVAGGDGSGGGDEILQRFARDVQKFRMGENVSSAEIVREDDGAAPAAAAANEAKPKAKVILDEAAAQRERIRLREVEARDRQREEQDRSRRKKEEEERERRREAAAAKKRQTEALRGKKAAGRQQKVKQSSVRGKSAADAKQKQPEGKKNNQSSGAVTAKKMEPKSKEATKRQPVKGEPKGKPCGCYGSKHKPLTNCLRCGRIACEAEGINDYCHCCGYFVSDISHNVITGDAKIDSALRHKERLLEFDKTSVARTHVHDDQEDYFVASTSMWATQEEQEVAEGLEVDRQKKLLRQKNPVLDINFD